MHTRVSTRGALDERQEPFEESKYKTGEQGGLSHLPVQGPRRPNRRPADDTQMIQLVGQRRVIRDSGPVSQTLTKTTALDKQSTDILAFTSGYACTHIGNQDENVKDQFCGETPPEQINKHWSPLWARREPRLTCTLSICRENNESMGRYMPSPYFLRSLQLITVKICQERKWSYGAHTRKDVDGEVMDNPRWSGWCIRASGR
ncbi:hypothetical protein B0H16DRAFT_1457436 [Mycena metata]|uniref:Uncharacterized protein n=1 Tax=Mycena metata TaxID=1033252 RepID=A0AAD7J9K4_9AGAR|nr:hypothetical protein B0H16DRAFT_1457436 [Mycena metata]